MRWNIEKALGNGQGASQSRDVERFILTLNVVLSDAKPKVPVPLALMINMLVSDTPGTKFSTFRVFAITPVDGEIHH